MLDDLLAFTVAALLLAMAPGPSTALMVRQTMRAGRRAGLAAAVGDKIGLLFWGVAAALGLSALVAASAVAYNAIRVVGAVFLLALGVQSLLSARDREGNAATWTAAVSTGPQAGGQDARSLHIGIVTSLANPKGAVFAMSFLPQFVPTGVPVRASLLLLAVVWAIVDGSWSLLLILLIGRAKAMLSRPRVRRRLEQVSGVVLIGLGIRLATDHR